MTKAEVIDVSAGRPRRIRKTSNGHNGKLPALSPDKELASCEARIEEAQRRGGQLFYDIAVELKRIYDSKCWVSVVNEMDEQQYSSFVHYTRERWNLKKDITWSYLAVAGLFDRETASSISTTRLRILARVPSEEDRHELLEQLRDGQIITTRELAELVKAARKKAGESTEKKVKEQTLRVAQRIKPGQVLFEGESKQRKGGRYVSRFEFGGEAFEIETNDQDLGFVVRHVKSKR